MSNASSSQNALRRPDNVINEDISIGQERFKIRVINNVNEEIPDHFTYATETILSEEVEALISSEDGPYWCKCEAVCERGTCSCEDSSIVVFDPVECLVRDPVNANHKRYVECGKHCRCQCYCKRQLSDDMIMKRVEVRHRDRLGFGVVALEHIPAGAPIANYVGKLITGDHWLNHSIKMEDFVFNIVNEDGVIIDIDATDHGNVTRFINHSCDPNVIFVKAYPFLYPPGVKKISIPKLVVVARRDIKPGEELLLNYGRDYFRVQGSKCRCHSNLCLDIRCD